MTRKSTYEELEKEVKEVNKESTERRLVEEELNTVRVTSRVLCQRKKRGSNTLPEVLIGEHGIEYSLHTCFI